jgi:hypothetical protein
MKILHLKLSTRSQFFIAASEQGEIGHRLPHGPRRHRLEASRSRQCRCQMRALGQSKGPRAPGLTNRLRDQF